MGHILSFKVLAEVLEKTGQRGILRGKDPDNYQGHIISIPVPAVEFSGTLQEAARALGLYFGVESTNT